MFYYGPPAGCEFLDQFAVSWRMQSLLAALTRHAELRRFEVGLQRAVRGEGGRDGQLHRLW